MTDNRTIHEQAQFALESLNCSDLDAGIHGLSSVLERIGPDSPDVAIIQRAIDRLDEITWEISDIGVMLANADFSFGKIVG
jgi:hypothetical protein